MPAGFSMVRATAVLLMMTWSLGSLGCRPTAPPEETGTSATEAPAKPQDQDVAGGRGLKIRPNVKTFPGLWGMVMTQPLPDQTGSMTFRDVCLSLIELTAGKEGGMTGKVVASLPDVPPTEISDVKVDGQKLSFQFQWGERTGDFEGTLVDGVIRGNLKLQQAGITPVMLRPTEEKTYEGWDPAPLAAGRTVFSEASKSKDQPAAILAVAREMRGSALALQSYDRVLAQLREMPEVDAAQMQQIYDDSLRSAELWGRRLVGQKMYQAAVAATMARRVPDLALKWIDAAEKLEPDLLLADQRESLKYLREQAQVDQALAAMKSKDAAVVKAAYEKLQGFLPSQQYQPEILSALGTYAAAHGEEDAAIGYLADIVALPMLEMSLMELRAGQPPGDPTPREQLLALWKKREGSEEGFDQFIRETYNRRLDELKARILADDPPLVEPDQQVRTVLVELMTGSMCPTCVAADLAATILQEQYPDKVALVKYHQHNPGPDPLTNVDSEERYAYYQAAGTPMAWIDGMVPPPGVRIAGLLNSVESSYMAFRGMVDYQLKVPMTGKLDLSARVENGNLILSAAATGLPEAELSKLRLRLALVDAHVDLVAPNGIRDQHNIMREMPGGAKGTPARNGKLEYSLQMPLAEIEAHLNDYLQQFEVGRDLEFLQKPTKTGALTLVGWVQDESNHLVLVTAKAPVDGTGPVSAPQPATNESTEAESAPPASAAAPENVKAD